MDWKSVFRLLGSGPRASEEAKPEPGPSSEETKPSGDEPSSDGAGRLAEPSATVEVAAEGGPEAAAPENESPDEAPGEPSAAEPQDGGAGAVDGAAADATTDREPAAPPASREEALEQEISALRAELRDLRQERDRESSERQRLEEEVRALADQDPLTGLASERRLADRLGVAIIHARRQRLKLAVVQLGLDRFEDVNRRLGRSHGDDLLRTVALALESTLRQGDTIARLGGDVFTVLLPGIRRDEDVTVVADKLRLALRSPFSIGGHDLLVTASIGIALFPDDGPDTESLVQSAAVAMRRAKERGGDTWDVHAPRSRALVAERQARETALRRALVQGELELYWQPVVECETGAIVAMESLLRWRNPQGVMRAAEFVSLADVSGLAVPLGQWTLRGACQQGRKWHEAGHDSLVVSVNVSVQQLAHAALVKLVRRVLDETRLPARCLEIEVSETDLGRTQEIVIERLEELRRIGLRIALDDFGTGESRIAHLYRYPIDTLKIDGSVVRDAVTNRDHEAVITAAVALARSRRLAVVAEGVETEAQRVLLVRWQCDRMQGNLSGPPVTAAEAEALLLRQRRAAREVPPAAPASSRRLL
jgi:diguanylate cyclase (GGDEF)-like protein